MSHKEFLALMQGMAEHLRQLGHLDAIMAMDKCQELHKFATHELGADDFNQITVRAKAAEKVIG